MTSTPRLVAFDLDDTLAPRRPRSTRAWPSYCYACSRVPVCVISGGQYGQFTAQVIDNLTGATPRRSSGCI